MIDNMLDDRIFYFFSWSVFHPLSFREFRGILHFKFDRFFSIKTILLFFFISRSYELELRLVVLLIGIKVLGMDLVSAKIPVKSVGIRLD